MNGAKVISKKVWAIALAACLAALAFAWSAASAQPAWAVDQGSLAAGSMQTQAGGLYPGQTFKVNGNTYRVTDVSDDFDDLDEAMLVSYGSTNKAPKINTVRYQGRTFEVDTIGANAFNNARGHQITSVTLGRNVDAIGPKAFYGCKKLAKVNMRSCDVIDIDRGWQGYYLDDMDIRSAAFKNAGTKNVKVYCGSGNASFQKVFKQALISCGMKSSVKVVR